MPKQQVVIDLENGIVNVYASQPEQLEVVLVDWDHEVNPSSRSLVRVHRGRHADTAFVASFSAQPLRELAGSDIERAIDEAEAQGAILLDSGAVPC